MQLGENHLAIGHGIQTPWLARDKKTTSAEVYQSQTACGWKSADRERKNFSRFSGHEPAARVNNPMKDGSVDNKILEAAKHWTLVQPVVSAYVGAVVRDFAARDDVLQEIAVAVLESFDRYDRTKPFQSWALGIARNQVHNYFRRISRDRLTFDEQIIAHLADAFDASAADFMQRLQLLGGCIDHLDDRARRVLEWRYRDDLKPAMIAQKMNSNANAVAKMLQRIRDRLRECIQNQSAKEDLR
jgi:RNA polymerase sigma-70 factor (ECF subfamily)